MELLVTYGLVAAAFVAFACGVTAWVFAVPAVVYGLWYLSWYRRGLL